MKLFQRWQERGRRARCLREAETLTLEGDLRGALNRLEAVLEETPDDADTERKAIELYAELGDADEASRRLTARIERDIRAASFLNDAVFDRLRDAPAFRQTYETAARLLKEHLESNEDAALSFVRAEFCEALDRPEDAHATYARLAESDDASGRAQAAYANARLYASTGNAESTAEWLRRAAEDSPNILDAFEREAMFDVVRQAEPLQAAGEFLLERRVEGLWATIGERTNNPAPFRELIELLLRHGQTDSALTVAGEAAEKFPNDPDTLEQYANTLFDSDRLAESMDVYQDILRLRARHPWALYRTGVIYDRTDRTEAARSAYWDALEATREDASLAYLVARGFARAGDANGAVEALRRAAALIEQFGTVAATELLAGIASHADFDPLRDQEPFQSTVEAIRDRFAEIDAPEDPFA